MFRIRVFTHNYARATAGIPDHWYGVKEAAAGYDPAAPNMLYASRNAALNQMLKWSKDAIVTPLTPSQHAHDTYGAYPAAMEVQA